MEQALIIACIGYLLCFVVLGVIWAVLAVMKNFFVTKEKTPEKAEPVVQKPSEPVKESVKSDDGELIAVLTAAVAASLNTSTYNLKIKSFRQLPNGVTRWGTAGVNENLANKLL